MHESPPLTFVNEVQGVRLKHFERVVTSLLVAQVRPNFVRLPLFLGSNADEATTTCPDSWPFNKLPSEARVLGNQEGQLADPKRAKRKEDQLRSMLRCILVLVPVQPPRNYTIVDFGGGSGHLAIPLAYLLPTCKIVVVDLSERSLDLLHAKADRCNRTDTASSSRFTADDGLRSCRGISNLFTFHGPVHNFEGHFDMAVALHLCGEATDTVLRQAGRMNASAIVVAPCCVGKLSVDNKNPYIYQATGSDSPTISYPQSSIYCELVKEVSDWNALAKAADYSAEAECRSSRNATRRTAKALVEADRQLYLEETFHFKSVLTRMEPWEATPKNDILVAWKEDSLSRGSDQFNKPDPDCIADVLLTINNLVPSHSQNSATSSHNMYWSLDEEKEIRQTLEEFLSNTEQSTEEEFVFPTRLGARKRKLIHHVAEQMDLAHWRVGHKNADRTVVVARHSSESRSASLNN